MGIRSPGRGHNYKSVPLRSLKPLHRFSGFKSALFFAQSKLTYMGICNPCVAGFEFFNSHHDASKLDLGPFGAKSFAHPDGYHLR